MATMHMESLEEQAMSLSEEERLELAIKLIESARSSRNRPMLAETDFDCLFSAVRMREEDSQPRERKRTDEWVPES